MRGTYQLTRRYGAVHTTPHQFPAKLAAAQGTHRALCPHARTNARHMNCSTNARDRRRRRRNSKTAGPNTIMYYYYVRMPTRFVCGTWSPFLRRWHVHEVTCVPWHGAVKAGGQEQHRTAGACRLPQAAVKMPKCSSARLQEPCHRGLAPAGALR